MKILFATLFMILPFTAAVTQKFAAFDTELLPSQVDSVAMLAQTWVLREKLQEHNNQLEPVLPVEDMRFTFLPDGTYTLTRSQTVPSMEGSIQVVEEGRWEFNTARGLIGMQTTLVDGKSILSTMMYRWQVEELTPRQLILQQFGTRQIYLVLEQAK